MTKDSIVTDPFLNEEDASKHIGRSRSWMNQARCKGYGPAFVKFKSRAVRYRLSALDKWLLENSSGEVHSNAEAKARVV